MYFTHMDHPGTCFPRCPRCDRKHPGTCTAFCRKCAGIGHSWRHCRLSVPEHIWRKQRRGVHTSWVILCSTVLAEGCWPVPHGVVVLVFVSINSATLFTSVPSSSGLSKYPNPLVTFSSLLSSSSLQCSHNEPHVSDSPCKWEQ
jgi:hypothetical protein